MREIAPGVVGFDDGRILTRNLVPGQRVYDEELHTVEGQEFRTWNPTRSKLGAYLMKGGQNFPLRADSRVLYLGAANGTTPSHVSDVVRDGLMVAVEFSPRSFRDLLRMSTPRGNVVPILADAWRPELYARYLGKVDFLFQDIAQRQQAAIFAKNVNRFKPASAMLAIKARSVDVAAHPRDVYDRVAAEVAELTGYEVIEMVDLGPYEKDHAAIVLRPGGAPGRKREAASTAQRRDDRPAQETRGGYRQERPGGFQRRDERPQGGGGFQRRDDRPQGGGGGFQRRDDRPGGFQPRGGGGGGGFRPRDDRPQGGGGFQPREDRGPPPRFERRDDAPPSDDRPPRRFDPGPQDKQDRPGGFNRRKWK
jgi:fibrillarin-like pre-rRNA processing protein